MIRFESPSIFQANRNFICRILIIEILSLTDIAVANIYDLVWKWEITFCMWFCDQYLWFGLKVRDHFVCGAVTNIYDSVWKPMHF
jgi:hypothetical protein